jgi:hypothetical protein
MNTIHDQSIRQQFCIEYHTAIRQSTDNMLNFTNYLRCGSRIVQFLLRPYKKKCRVSANVVKKKKIE